MWGKILTSLAFLIFVNCAATTTCDPKLANPGCPDKRVCDPTGICQKTCDSSVDCTDPDATICDKSSIIVGTLCQRDPTASSGCPAGQISVNLKTDLGQPNKTVCKLQCFGNPSSSCASGPDSPVQYTCQVPTLGSGAFYCWGTPS